MLKRRKTAVGVFTWAYFAGWAEIIVIITMIIIVVVVVVTIVILIAWE